VSLGIEMGRFCTSGNNRRKKFKRYIWFMEGLCGIYGKDLITKAIAKFRVR
jgi:hypothetical protein